MNKVFARVLKHRNIRWSKKMPDKPDMDDQTPFAIRIRDQSAGHY